MDTRIIRQEEVLEVLRAVWKMYVEQDIKHCTEEEIKSFQTYIEYMPLLDRIRRSEVFLHGVYEYGELKGVGAITNTGYITFLCSAGGAEEHQIKIKIIQTMREFAHTVLKLHTIKVESIAYNRDIYLQCGFVQFGREYLKAGQVVVPLEGDTAPVAYDDQSGSYSQSGPYNQRAKMSTALIVAIICVAAFGAIVVTGLIGFTVVRNASLHNRSDTSQEYEPDDSQEYEGSVEEEIASNGLDTLTPYIKEGMEIAIENETWNEVINEPEKQIGFSIQYPSITGIDNQQSKSVNDKLKDTAMQEVNAVYYKPNEEMKEKILLSPQLILHAEVTYKVCYLNETLVSTAFEENNYFENLSNSSFSLRTANINLDTGEAYEIKDIVKLNDAFMKDWFQRMEKEAPGSSVLSQDNREQLEEVLSEGNIEGKYTSAFFVRDGVIEIGFSYTDEVGDKNSFGWITAPFTFEELKKYKTDSSFWEAL